MSDALTIILAVAALAVTGAALWARRRYGAVFRMAHVRAFVDRIDSLRAAALDHYDRPLRAGDPRTTVTPAGLAVAYTIVEEGDRYRHHLSVSHGRTTRAAGARFLLLGVRRLGAGEAEVGLGISPAGVYHAGWLLDAEQQARFVDQRPASLDGSTLEAMFARCADEAAQVPFERLTAERVGTGEATPAGRS